MNFLEKNLEDIIWDNYERCAERGLNISQNFYMGGLRHRQLNLAPYGIADIVNIRYRPADKSFYCQVIELKRGKVDMSAYMQAKRYATALRYCLVNVMQRMKAEGEDFESYEGNVYINCILVGDEIEKSGDFTFVLNADYSVEAYVYKYGFDGMQFEAAGKEWCITGYKDSTALAAVLTQSITHARSEQRSADVQAMEDSIELRSAILAEGDWSKALLLTPEGVTINPEALSLGQEQAYDMLNAMMPREQDEKGGEDGDE